MIDHDALIGAASALYAAGHWTCPQIDESRAALLWRRLGDALCFSGDLAPRRLPQSAIVPAKIQEENLEYRNPQGRNIQLRDLKDGDKE